MCSFIYACKIRIFHAQRRWGINKELVRELTTLWAFLLHVYLYKNYNPNHKWEIITLRTLHDLEDQHVM
jgi:hypothetical protein